MLQVDRAVYVHVACQTSIPACHSAGVNTEVSQCEDLQRRDQQVVGESCSVSLSVDNDGHVELRVDEKGPATAEIQFTAAVHVQTDSECIQNEMSCAPDANPLQSERVDTSTWGHIVPPQAWMSLLVAVTRQNTKLQSLLGLLLAILFQQRQQQKSSKSMAASDIVDENTLLLGAQLCCTRAMVLLPCQCLTVLWSRLVT